jgi:hypothetical protein
MLQMLLLSKYGLGGEAPGFIFHEVASFNWVGVENYTSWRSEESELYDAMIEDQLAEPADDELNYWTEIIPGSGEYDDDGSPNEPEE